MTKTFNHFWPVYKNLETETLELANYIQFSDDQLSVYSMHIADLLVRCSMEIEAISKELYKLSNGPKVYDTNGNERQLYFDTDCLAYLDKQWGICARKVMITATRFYFINEEFQTLQPLKNADKRGKAKWKKAYQAVKHDRKNSIKQGNINNLLLALAALYILNVYYKDNRIDLGETNNPEQVFDSRFGSEIFSVTVANATVDIELNGKVTDKSLSMKKHEECKEAIYIIRLTDSARVEIFKTMEWANKNIIKTLEGSEAYKKYLLENNGQWKKGENIYTLVPKVLGSDYIKTVNPFGRAFGAFIYGHKEAILNKNQSIYENSVDLDELNNC